MQQLSAVDFLALAVIVAGLLMVLRTRKLIEHFVWRHISTESLNAFLDGRLGKAYFGSTQLIGVLACAFGIVLIIFNQR